MESFLSYDYKILVLFPILHDIYFLCNTVFLLRFKQFHK